MSHNVERFEFPLNVSKTGVQKQLDNYVAHADWKEGCTGLNSPIRWLDDKVYDSYDDAVDAIDRLDRGWYDSLAVQYYNREYSSDAKYKELSAKADDARREYERRDAVLYASTVTSEYIGCKKCGSRLARKFLYTNFCPVCKNNLRSESTMKSIEAAKAKWNRANKTAAEYLEKKAKKNIMWLVKIEYHT